MKKITRDLVSKWVPIRDEDTYKNKMGHVLCIGGNENMGGAILLSAGAALHAGAGLVTVASAPTNVHALHARLPEAMFVDMYDKEALSAQIKKADVIIIGPGLGLTDSSLSVFKTALAAINENQWLVVDGDGLSHFVNDSLTLPTPHTVFTPHLGEWRRLTGIEAPADDVEKNADEKERLEATIVLKKERTEVYLKKDIWQNTSGNPSMATGGMGDTLTGLLGSFLGQFEDKQEAILSAVYVHSAVADELAKDYYVTLPSKLIETIPLFMKKL